MSAARNACNSILCFAGIDFRRVYPRSNFNDTNKQAGITKAI